MNMPQISDDPASLTKERLKSDLVAHNIGLPPSDARKDTYVKLYLKHLTPLRNIQPSGDGDSPLKSEFSSDEESTPMRKVQQKKATKKAQRTINRDDIEIEKEVANLSDRELAEELKNFGMSPGPITGSTRSVYERKLVRLRVDGPQEQKQTNGSDDYSDSDEGSSSDEDNSQDTEVVTQQTQVRKREVTKKSLHVTQTTEEQTKTTSSSQGETTVSGSTQTTKTQTTTSTTTPELKKRLIPVFVQIIILLLVALFIFLILYNMESLPQRKIPESLPGGSKMKVE